MNSNFKKSIFDSVEDIIFKTKQLNSTIEVEKDILFNEEVAFINNIVKKLAFLLPREDFSCKNGILLYTFEHKDRDREVYISPDVYLIEADCIVYEVLNPQKYHKVSSNDILISRKGKYFCEIQLKQFLEYVSPEEICNFISNFINEDYKELTSIEKRAQFLKSPSIKL